MVVCETIPMLPDTTLAAGESVLSEPIEVGPYLEGLVFVKIMEADDVSLNVDIGFSPYGYDDWEEHWTVHESHGSFDQGMHEIQLSNFGNFLRLQCGATGLEADEVTFQAWFVGKG